jgi:hypothetical protein
MCALIADYLVTQRWAAQAQEREGEGVRAIGGAKGGGWI